MSRVLSSLTAACLGLSCAAFPGGRLGPIGTLPTPQAAKPSISVATTSSAMVGDEFVDFPPGLHEEWTSWVLEEYRQSKLFSVVRHGLYESDLRAEVTVTDVGESHRFLAFLSGLTFFVVPSTAEDRLDMVTRFQDVHGSDLGAITKSESIRQWIQIFLVFLSPFQWPHSVAQEVFSNLTRATLVEAGERGVFSGVTPAAAEGPELGAAERPLE